MQYASYGSITFFGRVSMISFNLIFSGSGSPICLKPYLSANWFLYSAVSAEVGTIGTATACRTLFLFENKNCGFLLPFWRSLSPFR